MRYLLDADSIIDYFANQPGALTGFPQFLRDGSAVSGTTVIELYTGVYGARDPTTA